jgi:hypothetical protein
MTDDEATRMEKRLLERIDQVEARIERVETNMLNAFYNWSGSVGLRLREIPLFDARLGLLEERVTSLERQNGKTQKGESHGT